MDHSGHKADLQLQVLLSHYFFYYYMYYFLEGIWPDGADGTDVNSVSRSNGKQLLATGDDFGNVNLFRYPCVSDKVCTLIFLNLPFRSLG